MAWATLTAQLASNGLLGWTAVAGNPNGALDTILGRAVAANLRLGDVAANPPVAQTLSVQNASGSNIAGANFTIDLSQGTGTGAGGGLVIRSAAAGGAGSALNALATLLTIGPINVTLASGLMIVPDGTAGAPSLRGTTSALHGLFWGSSGIHVSLDGVDRFLFDRSGTSYRLQLGNTTEIAWSSTVAPGTADLLLGRAAAANLRLGATVGNPPVAQTISVQNASGTDIVGANWTFNGSRGTGTGAGGSFIFSTAAAGLTGSTLNPLATLLTIGPTNVTLASGAGLFWSTDLSLYRDAANILAQRNGTAAQMGRWYETFTDSANNARVEILTQAGEYHVRQIAVGTGPVRDLSVGTQGASNLNLYTSDIIRWTIGATPGHLTPQTTNTTNIGSASLRPLQIFVGTSGIDSTGAVVIARNDGETLNTSGARSHTSGSGVNVSLSSSFTPASGSGSWAGVHILPTINGTSSGTAYGLVVASRTNVLTGGTVKLASFGTTSTDAFTGYTPVFDVFTTGVAIGTATPTTITNIRIYSQTITPASVAAAVCAEQTFTVTGLTTADKVFVNPVATGNGTSAAQVRVSTADTLAVTYCNPTAGALTPAAGTMQITAVRS